MKFLKIFTKVPELLPEYLKPALTDIGLLMVDLDPFDVLLEGVEFDLMEVWEDGVLIEKFY